MPKRVLLKQPHSIVITGDTHWRLPVLLPASACLDGDGLRAACAQSGCLITRAHQKNLAIALVWRPTLDAARVSSSLRR